MGVHPVADLYLDHDGHDLINVRFAGLTFGFLEVLGLPGDIYVRSEHKGQIYT